MANTIVSPYASRPRSEWPSITKRLLHAHPLSPHEILEIADAAWASLWKSTIGAGQNRTPLKSLTVPATVVGYLFEILFSNELLRRSNGLWRGSNAANEKDLVHTKDSRFSIELKTSGQLGSKVFGNRSYAQKRSTGDRQKKEKSGYHVTVNFYRQTMTLVRFGWIDSTDWSPQLAPTGQMAGLSDDVYRWKLVEIVGNYQLKGPIELLHGIGPKRARELQTSGIETIGDLIAYSGLLPSTVALARDELRKKFPTAER